MLRTVSTAGVPDSSRTGRDGWSRARVISTDVVDDPAERGHGVGVAQVARVPVRLRLAPFALTSQGIDHLLELAHLVHLAILLQAR